MRGALSTGAISEDCRSLLTRDLFDRHLRSGRLQIAAAESPRASTSSAVKHRHGSTSPRLLLLSSGGAVGSRSTCSGTCPPLLNSGGTIASRSTSPRDRRCPGARRLRFGGPSREVNTVCKVPKRAWNETNKNKNGTNTGQTMTDAAAYGTRFVLQSRTSKVRNTRPQGGYCASQNQEGYALRCSHVGLTPYSFSFALRRCSSQPHTRTERRYIQTG